MPAQQRSDDIFRGVQQHQLTLQYGNPLKLFEQFEVYGTAVVEKK